MFKIVGNNEIIRNKKWIVLLVSDNYFFDRKTINLVSRKCGCVYIKSMAIDDDKLLISFHFEQEKEYRRFKNGILHSPLYDSRIKL